MQLNQEVEDENGKDLTLLHSVKCQHAVAQPSCNNSNTSTMKVTDLGSRRCMIHYKAELTTIMTIIWSNSISY